MANRFFIRLPEVSKRTSLPRSTIYDKISRSEFPAPIKLGKRSSAWDSREIDQWMIDRIGASRPDDAELGQIQSETEISQ